MLDFSKIYWNNCQRLLSVWNLLKFFEYKQKIRPLHLQQKLIYGLLLDEEEYYALLQIGF